MILTADKTTFRRIQTDDPAKITAFFSVDATDALGRPVDPPMEPITLDLTEAEAAFANALVERARTAYVASKNEEPQP